YFQCGKMDTPIHEGLFLLLFRNGKLALDKPTPQIESEEDITLVECLTKMCEGNLGIKKVGDENNTKGMDRQEAGPSKGKEKVLMEDEKSLEMLKKQVQYLETVVQVMDETNSV
ncbi:hypothetical protein KI387_029613, partial [Taxus chinensis]